MFADKDLVADPHSDVKQELARFRRENELLRQEKDSMSLDRLCTLAGVSISGYYAWKHRPPSWRQLDDMIVLAHFRNQFVLSCQTYGSPRMHVELCEERISVGRYRKASLMRENNLKARQKTR